MHVLVYESLAVLGSESEDVRFIATEDFLGSEKTKGVSWRGVVKWDSMAQCLLEVACLVVAATVAT